MQYQLVIVDRDGNEHFIQNVDADFAEIRLVTTDAGDYIGINQELHSELPSAVTYDAYQDTIIWNTPFQGTVGI